MWESLFIQLISVWVIACAFGFYFVVVEDNQF
jgi:hypothetical protein